MICAGILLMLPQLCCSIADGTTTTRVESNGMVYMGSETQTAGMNEDAVISFENHEESQQPPKEGWKSQKSKRPKVKKGQKSSNVAPPRLKSAVDEEKRLDGPIKRNMRRKARKAV